MQVFLIPKTDVSGAIRMPLESETGRRANSDTPRGFGLTLPDEDDYLSQGLGNNRNNTSESTVPAGIFFSQIGFYAPQKEATSNAEKINGILEDENIPENYFCPLTMSIMTDPVYLPNDVTKKVFERSSITRWLSEKSATHPSRTGPHPFNPNARFSATDLLPENNLKKAIDAFVEQICPSLMQGKRI